MKPTRGLSGPWLNMPRERRVALASVAILVALLGSLLLYERFTQTQPESMPETMGPVPPFAQSADSQVAASPAAGAGSAAAFEPQVMAAEEAAPVVAAPKVIDKPLTGRPSVLRPYGFGSSDIYEDYRLHPGIDYAAKLGESVVAVAAGKVLGIETDPVEGRLVEIDHGGGMITRYGGLGKVMVTANTTVQPGTIIGQVGEPTPVKQSRGTHLHFEVLMNGHPEDPASYFRP